MLISSSGARSRITGFVISLVLASGLLWLAGRSVSWTDFGAAAASLDLKYAALAMLSLFIMYAVITWRWSQLWPAKERPAWPSLVTPVMIGYLVNTVTPMRLGDLARATVVARRGTTSIGSALGTIIIEHVFDFGVLIALVVTFASFVDIPPTVRPLIFVGAAALLGAVGAIAFLARRRPPEAVDANGNRGKFGRLVSVFFRQVVQLRHGLEIISDPSTVFKVAALTLVVWTLMGVYAVLWAAAFEIPIPWYAAVFAIAVAGLAASIPGTPAAIGTFQLAIVLALSPWSTDRSLILAYGVVLHGAQIATNLLVGGLLTVREGTKYGLKAPRQASCIPVSRAD